MSEMGWVRSQASLNCGNKITMWNFPRMREAVWFVLTLPGLCAATYKEFYYIKTPMTWIQAQSYCRDWYSDLATIENLDDNKVISNIPEKLIYVWIGYYDDLRFWKWALGNVDFNSDIDYQNWDLNQPSDPRSGESCAVVTQLGFWYDISCDNQRFAICFSEPVKPIYVFVDILMTWYQARDYCRSSYTDLASVTTLSDNNWVSSLVTGDAWMGLHRVPWSWSDSSTSTFTNWGGIEFSSISSWTSCVMASTTTGLWWQTDCGNSNYFICQSVSSLLISSSVVQDSALTTTTMTTTTTSYKIKFKSEEDLQDPVLQQQMLKQLLDKLKKHLTANIKLRWMQTDVKKLTKEQEEAKCSPVYSK